MQEIILLVLLYSPETDLNTIPHEDDGSGSSVHPMRTAIVEWLMKEIGNMTAARTTGQEPSQLTKVLWNQDPHTSLSSLQPIFDIL